MLFVAPYFVLMILVTVVFALPVWRFIDEPKAAQGQRINTLDGLRGYLALSVMVHHSVVAGLWLKTGAWALPSDVFYSRLGSTGVALFFMITGYLFWGKLIRAQGRPDFIALYISRVFRIAPVYCIAITGMVLVVMWRSGFEIREPFGGLVDKIGHWYGLGLLVGRDFNAYPDVWIILAGVVWTLKYEWRFYFALLPASLFARPNLHLIAASVAFAGTLFWSAISTAEAPPLWMLFTMGMLTASIGIVRPLARLPDAVRSLAVIALLVSMFALRMLPYSREQSLVLGGVFFLLCNRTTLFGLLISTPAIRLGHISYGIYLFQGFVFSLGFANHSIARAILQSTTAFWFAACVGMLALCAVAAVIHVSVERPMIDAGHRIGLRARGRKLAAKVAR
ncbi:MULTISPECIES: acyltransferase family protein [Caballeronia]|uniref:acyltransferase family protein n=1 Tax=Caballeronia TaxID=1827195 RepID=UPI001EF4AEF0|nr:MULTISPECIES: acyltransferase [Caballeronia]MCG7402295.1 acyltransferase [Caballeronia zhejiangensis]MCI1047169.1 acyltransferase [Caballeronia zhejiangensis]